MRKYFVRLARNTGLQIMLCAPFISAAAPVSEGVVTVYQHCGYQGYGVHLPPGNYSMEKLLARGLLNDDLSSIRVPEGYTVTIYEHDFQGRSRTLTRSDECLVDSGFNDVTSSISVSQAEIDAGGVDSHVCTPPGDVTQLDLSGEYTIQHRLNYRFLDAYLDKRNYNVVTRIKQDDDSQVWILTSTGRDGIYTIKQKQNLRFLDAYGSRSFKAVTRPAQGDDSQRWRIMQGDETDIYRIQQVANGRYLDAYNRNNYQAVTRGRQKDVSQLWILKNVEKFDFKEIHYCLDAAVIGAPELVSVSSACHRNIDVDAPNELEIEHKVWKGTTSSFERTEGFEVEAGMELSVGVPEVCSATAKVSVSRRDERTFGEEESTGKSVEIDTTVTLDPGETVGSTAVFKRAEISVPYVMIFESESPRKTIKKSYGMYRGVESYGAVIEIQDCSRECDGGPPFICIPKAASGS